MNPIVYYIASGVLVIGVLVGIALMSKVRLAVAGNLISALCMASAIVLTLVYNSILPLWILWLTIAAGLVVGLIWASRIKMIEMPEIVALFNGFGGAASALVAFVTLIDPATLESNNRLFALITGAIALAVGMVTLTGSLVAGGKLHKILPQKPVVLKGHRALTAVTLVLTLCSGVLIVVNVLPAWAACLLCTVLAGCFGVVFSIRVGGADMPITISLLNSLSGVAGSIAGMAIGDPLLVAVGGVVGASGLLLTQIMCKAMNRKLLDILLGKTSAPAKKAAAPASENAAEAAPEEPAAPAAPEKKDDTPAAVLKAAGTVIIIPGYGMALAQAQHQVKQLADKLKADGKDVAFAIHPVAGRMPGHMNVLLAEADVPYEDLHEMEEINPKFADCDVAVIIGANDVVNPAAREAEGTPIYGMPVLDVDKAKHVIICNFDLKPGYAGVENPLYHKDEGVTLLLGDAKQTLGDLLAALNKSDDAPAAEEPQGTSVGAVLANAKHVILVPGYGMALAQAQHQVKKLADLLDANGIDTQFAIHPVAGRMPGHMNVLLAEADVPYEKLHEMEEINPQFADCDAAIIIGANDVVNPAAREAEGTPIYGMPVLDVDKAKHVIVCNFDLKPGYAGVENPLYHKDEGVTLMLGDAKQTVDELCTAFLNAKNGAPAADEPAPEAAAESPASVLKAAKTVIIVPGYGMALAQAQHYVKQLADKLKSDGADVAFAIHPVAGRMPGHMNVLLAEADVPYEDLHEMEEINPKFDGCDVCVIIGANDVVNPAAREAEGTPIYGMPVLDVDKAKYVIICNYDLKPGYAGVENPLYHKDAGVALLLGDAKETLQKLLSEL